MALFLGKTYVVFGLARSGMATVQWLLDKGAHVIAIDQQKHLLQQALEKGAKTLDATDIDWASVTALVQSPGIPWKPNVHPITQKALDYGVPVLSDCDLLRRNNPDAHFVGITGTNGKSTTTAWVGHILKSAGRPVAIGGNIGKPALSLPQLDQNGIYVLELSSFQLDLSPSLNLDIAALINVGEDHLDRHGSMESYVSAKKNIFNVLDVSQVKIIGVDDSYSQQIYDDLCKDHLLVPISTKTSTKQGVYVEKNQLIDDMMGQKTPVLDLTQVERLKGSHNHQNMAIAYAICRSLGLSIEETVKGIITFPGLMHRQEWVADVKGVCFINDSKGTNAEATAKALDTFDTIYWIVGGEDKSDGIEPLLPYFPKVQQAFLIGAASKRFAKTLDGKVKYTVSKDLDVAVHDAFSAARKSDSRKKPVVLLSPACASYDQFLDFEHRGDSFKELVVELKNKT